MNTDLMFSKKSDEWETPQALFDLLDKEFHFELDAAATPQNTKCESFFVLPECNALIINWHELDELVYWLNPPYSNVSEFIKKAYEESLNDLIVVCLVPSRTDTKWWHEYVMKAKEIRFIKGRLKFGDSKNSAPFPSCVVIF